MRKVCHLTSVHTSRDTRIFHKECASLAKAGYEVYLVAPGESRIDKGVHVVGVGMKPQSRLRRMTEMARRVYQAGAALDCDIYHLHDPELLPYGVKLYKMGKHVIYDSHENYPEQIRQKSYLPSLLRNAIAGIYRCYETSCVRRFDAVVFPCTMLGTNIFEGRAKKTVFIDNMPLLEELDITTPNSKRETEDRNTVVHVGALTYARGITHLMKAVFHAGGKLVLAGTFSPVAYHDRLKGMAEYACVEYVGQLGRKQIVDVLQRASIGAATLLKVGQYGASDNLPTKVLEYMGVGLPVIVTDYPYARIVMEKHQCGICVEPDNIQQITDAVRYLMDHPGVARAMGQNGREAVLTEYNWNAERGKLLRLYATI